MNNELLQQAKELASRNYLVNTYEERTNENKKFMAFNPELYGCMAEGETSEEAINNLADARVDYIYSLLVDGLEVPHPTSQPQPTIETTAEAAQYNVLKTIYIQGKTTSTQPLNPKKTEISLTASV